MLVPANAEQVVEHLYGSDWRVPQPGFFWLRDRTDRADEAIMPPDYGQTIYWATFYARKGLPRAPRSSRRSRAGPARPVASSTSAVAGLSVYGDEDPELSRVIARR